MLLLMTILPLPLPLYLPNSLICGPARFIPFVRSGHDYFFWRGGGGIESGILPLQKHSWYEKIFILFYTSLHIHVVYRVFMLF